MRADDGGVGRPDIVKSQRLVPGFGVFRINHTWNMRGLGEVSWWQYGEHGGGCIGAFALGQCFAEKFQGGRRLCVGKVHDEIGGRISTAVNLDGCMASYRKAAFTIRPGDRNSRKGLRGGEHRSKSKRKAGESTTGRFHLVECSRRSEIRD